MDWTGSIPHREHSQGALAPRQPGFAGSSSPADQPPPATRPLRSRNQTPAKRHRLNLKSRLCKRLRTCLEATRLRLDNNLSAPHGTRLPTNLPERCLCLDVLAACNACNPKGSWPRQGISFSTSSCPSASAFEERLTCKVLPPHIKLSANPSEETEISQNCGCQHMLAVRKRPFCDLSAVDPACLWMSEHETLKQNSSYSSCCLKVGLDDARAAREASQSYSLHCEAYDWPSRPCRSMSAK